MDLFIQIKCPGPNYFMRRLYKTAASYKGAIKRYSKSHRIVNGIAYLY